jgi:hypothetical protein
MGVRALYYSQDGSLPERQVTREAFLEAARYLERAVPPMGFTVGHVRWRAEYVFDWEHAPGMCDLPDVEPGMCVHGITEDEDGSAL